jgi:hypothetical protein
MIHSRRFITRWILLVGLGAVAMASPSVTPAALASGPSWLTIPAGQPLFDLAGIAPGDTGSATFVVTNPQPFRVRFSIGVTGLSNDDNGCNEPEREIGDTTCGPGGGELQSNLRLVLTATGNTDRPIAKDVVDEWAARPAVDTVSLSGYESRTYRIAYELPIQASNVTQSDVVAFQLEMRLEQELDSFASDPPPAVVVASTPLPGTGAGSGAMLTIGVGSILIGTCMYATNTRRRLPR